MKRLTGLLLVGLMGLYLLYGQDKDKHVTVNDESGTEELAGNYKGAVVKDDKMGVEMKPMFTRDKYLREESYKDELVKEEGIHQMKARDNYFKERYNIGVNVAGMQPMFNRDKQLLEDYYLKELGKEG